MQVCYIGIYVPWWFAAPITPSSTLGISPNVIPPLTPKPLKFLPCPPNPLRNPGLWCSPPCVHEFSLFNTHLWEYGYLFLCQFAENDRFWLHPCPCKEHKLIFFMAGQYYSIFHGVYVPHFLHSVYYWWAFGLVPSLCYCEQCCNEHSCAWVLIVEWFIILWIYTQ